MRKNNIKVRFKLPLRDRLLLYSHVDHNGCWLWQGTLFKGTGYGQITHNKKIYSTHRLVMHVFQNFDITSKALILHHCDVKNCINPNHLYVGDHAQNTKDAVDRYRTRRGSNHPNAKINEETVIKIIKRLNLGHDIKEIAKDYKTSPSTVGLIRKCRTWRHVSREQ